MNRRGFLASLFGTAAVVAAKPLLAFAPEPNALVLWDIPDVGYASPAYLDFRAKALADLSRWFAERIDQLAWMTLTGMPNGVVLIEGETR